MRKILIILTLISCFGACSQLTDERTVALLQLAAYNFYFQPLGLHPTWSHSLEVKKVHFGGLRINPDPGELFLWVSCLVPGED